METCRSWVISSLHMATVMPWPLREQGDLGFRERTYLNPRPSSEASSQLSVLPLITGLALVTK
jgi:hypothetical protein